MRWLSILWPKLMRGAPTREGRGSVRGGRGVVSESSSVRAWRWPLAVGVAVGALHFLLFPPLPRIAAEFPAAGEISTREIRAPFTFSAPQLERDVEMRRLEKVLVEPPVLRRLTTTASGDSRSRFEAFREALRIQLAHAEVPLAERVSLLALRFPAIPEDELRRVLTVVDPERVLALMREALVEVCDDGVTDMLPPGNYSKVVLLGPDSEMLQDVSLLTPQARLGERLTALLRAKDLPATDTVWAAMLVRHFITPNLIYDPAATRARQDQARLTVPTEREFIKGERIVDQGVRVTEQQALFLNRLNDLMVARGGAAADGRGILRVLGRLLLLAVVFGLYGWLARVHFPKLLDRPRLLIALGAVLAIYLVGAAFALSRPGLGPFAVPVPLLALLATVLFKERVGYATTLLALMLLGILPETSTGSLFVWLVLGMVTVVAVRRIQLRSQFYQTIALLTVLSVFLITVVRIAAGDPLSDLGREYLVGTFAPILTVAFALFLLPVVEPAVGVSSDLTLLELSDLNHPLLKRMALEAQGTYHHSQVVSQLAEQAARAIGANALLTRVGALFHDIGKMQKQEYFVENQRPGLNKHDELSPTMSALVVSAHVKEGMELARRWRLPQAVIDFIPEHHGTTVMEYFYHKALESEGNETVKVDDFRYPGPKPHSRETAILMLADAVEAATRSLAKPTPARIKERTKQIMDKRLLDGELDASGLSVSDLARIRESFVSLLSGIHHTRIAYPGQQEKEREKEPPRNGERKAAG
jgi:putative nucleotidyltransferase with HDIG domain